MTAYEAVKVRLDPTPRQERMLMSHAGAARFAFNQGLAHVKDGSWQPFYFFPLVPLGYYGR